MFVCVSFFLEPVDFFCNVLHLPNLAARDGCILCIPAQILVWIKQWSFWGNDSK